MQYERLGNNHSYKFESVSEFSAETIQAFRKGVHTSFAAARQKTLRDSSFTGRDVNSMEHAAKLSNEAWDEGIKTAQRFIDKLSDAAILAPVNIRRRSSWSEDGGDEVDLDRLRSGQAYWRTTSRQHRPGPVSKTIITDLTAGGNVDPVDVAWRSAAAICLTYLLEAAGYRVELWAVNCSQDSYTNGNGFSCSVKIKDLTQPVDLSSIANSCSCWFYRSLMFSSRMLNSKATPENGCGSPRKIDAELVEFITSDAAAIVCKGIWSEYAAIEWIKDELTKIQ